MSGITNDDSNKIQENMSHRVAAYHEVMNPYREVWDGITREHGGKIPDEFLSRATELIRAKVIDKSVDATALTQVALQLWEPVRYHPWDGERRVGQVSHEQIDDLFGNYQWLKGLNLPPWVVSEIVLLQRDLGYLPKKLSDPPQAT